MWWMIPKLDVQFVKKVLWTEHGFFLFFFVWGEVCADDYLFFYFWVVIYALVDRRQSNHSLF